jgi:hypothetical protein
VQRRSAGGDQTALETVLEPDLLAPAPGLRSRDVPEDIREFRAERYGAAARRR